MLQGKSQTPDLRQAGGGSPESRLERLGIEVGGLLQAAAGLASAPGRPALVQIAGVTGGEGATTVAQEFARMTRGRLGRQVCLVTTTDSAPAAAGQAGGAAVDGLGLRVISLPLETFNIEVSGGLTALLGGMSADTDLFVIDSPPINRSIAGFLISRQVSGTILVIDAGRTPVDAVETACRAVEGGGRLLGIVVNHRRYRVPRFLAEMLGLGLPPEGLPGSRRRWLWPALAALALAILGMALLQRQSPTPVDPAAVEGTGADDQAGE